MTRTALAASVLAAVLLAAPGPAPAAPPPAPKEAKFELRIRAQKPAVRLGEKIRIDCTLLSKSARAAAVARLRVGSPSSLVFYVKSPGRTYQVARLWGKYQGNDFKEAAIDRLELKTGKTLEETVDLLAILPGKLEISAVYLGADRQIWPDPVEAKAVPVTVEPGPGGETRVGARIRTTRGAMTAELYPDKAYNTVHNFLTLAQEGFYAGRVFHRIVKDFMVQTGDPNGNGTGGPGYCIPAEFNDVKHEKGVVSMARENHPNTAGSQFFVMTVKNAGLDGRYTAFGKVVEGLDVLDALAGVPVQRNPQGEMSDPLEKPKLEGVEMVLLK